MISHFPGQRLATKKSTFNLKFAPRSMTLSPSTRSWRSCGQCLNYEHRSISFGFIRDRIALHNSSGGQGPGIVYGARVKDTYASMFGAESIFTPARWFKCISPPIRSYFSNDYPIIMSLLVNACMAWIRRRRPRLVTDFRLTNFRPLQFF